MRKVSELFIESFKTLPIWVKQVITKEILEDLSSKMNEFQELVQDKDLFQCLIPKITFKGKQELQEHSMHLSEGYYAFLQDTLENNNIFEITLKNSWALADTAKIFIRLIELEFIMVENYETNKNVAVAMFIAGKIKTGEFLKRIGKINVTQLEQAIRYQKELNDEGRHIKMASILIKMGFITDKGLDSLLLLKDEARKRLPALNTFSTADYSNADSTNDQFMRLRREIARLENENTIMKKRLKKLLNING